MRNLRLHSQENGILEYSILSTTLLVDPASLTTRMQVFMMQAGFAFLAAGAVRSKNAGTVGSFASSHQAELSGCCRLPTIRTLCTCTSTLLNAPRLTHAHTQPHTHALTQAHTHKHTVTHTHTRPIHTQILLKSFIDMCIACISFWLVGYAFAFGAHGTTNGGCLPACLPVCLLRAFT